MAAALRVFETFLSLQGESTHAGRLCWFIRLAGCNLNCSYCDTRCARSFEAGREMSVADLITAALDSGAPLVEVTGGEPLAQTGTPELLAQLLATGVDVALETNGAVDITSVPPGVCRIVDYKLPSSGMTDRMLEGNFRCLTPRDEVKFVVGSREDYEVAGEVLRRFRLPEQTPNLLMSPVWGAVSWETLAEWIIADRLPARMQLQLHKLIWGADRQGV